MVDDEEAHHDDPSEKSVPMNGIWDAYNGFPLLQSMLRHQERRAASLRKEGSSQIDSPKGNAGWIRTFFVVEGRALDRIIFPWVLSMIHAVAYTVLTKLYFQVDHRDMESWEIFFALILNTTLSFLLVFRLNRAAGRYWTARALWGMIIAKARCFLGSIVAHADHDIPNRDNAIRWVIASNVAVMELLRGCLKEKVPRDNFAGILSDEEIDVLLCESNVHPPIYAYDQARHHVRKLFPIDGDTPAGLAHLWSRHIDSLEAQLNEMLECCGGLERIRATPLPIVYVAHLRTFLMIALFALPYIWGPSWGWNTIPIMAAASYAWLGIEGAAAEAQSPFGEKRVNALDMDGYCLSFMEVVTQQLRHHADRARTCSRNHQAGKRPSGSHRLNNLELSLIKAR